MREKLIELVNSAFTKCCSMICAQECDYYDKDLKAADRSCQAKLFADMLIANGVTFAKDTNVPSKWISVAEETPEESTNVLLRIKCQTTGTTAVTVGYCFTYYWCHQPMGLRWFERWRASYEPAGGVLDDSWDVTHWMRLPKEPKEDANG